MTNDQERTPNSNADREQGNATADDTSLDTNRTQERTGGVADTSNTDTDMAGSPPTSELEDR